MDEYYVRQKEEYMSKQLILNDTHSIEEYENEDNNKLREELELYKEKCQKLEQTVNILLSVLLLNQLKYHNCFILLFFSEFFSSQIKYKIKKI